MSNSNKKAAQIKVLKSDIDIQKLINEAYKILGNPIVLFDMDYKIIAYTENIVTDDPLFNELVTIGCFSDESIELFKNEGFIDAVANMDGITFLVSDKLKYERMVGKVYNKDNITVANVCIIFSDKEFGGDECLAFKGLCKKISEQFGKIEFYQNYGEVYQETIVGKLLDGDINDKVLYSGHIANIYERLKNNLYLVVVDITKNNPEYGELTHFRDLFRQTQRSFRYFIYSKYIVIIISSSAMKPNIKKSLHKLSKIFEQNNMYVGISSRFDNLFNLRNYYLEALSAIDYGLKNNRGYRISLYDEIMRNSS